MPMRTRTALLAAGALTVAGCATAGGGAQDAGADPAGTLAEGAVETGRGLSAGDADAAILDRFAPRPSGSDRAVDYTLIDEALGLIVFNSGPSLRRRQRRPDALSGTRFVRGHTSPYRLEGNKVFFSQFDDDVEDAISEYRRSLERIGASGRVQGLPRDEQLAYWYNLHNFVVIDEIAGAYPVRFPRTMTVGEDGASLHDAKVIDLGDVVLSLRDVREIVYTHWDDPKVVYGFYHGDLGGPSIRRRAYTGASVGADLGRQAREFVNSLRGVARGDDTLYVSELYGEARPHFFPGWPDDLRAHLRDYADAEVQSLLLEKPRTAFARYEDRVADMSGGEVYSDLGNRGSGNSGSTIPPSMVRMVSEYREKLDELREEGLLKPKVIIIDVPTDDPDETG